MTRPTTKPRVLAAVLLALTMGIGVLAGVALDRLVLLPQGAEAATPQPASTDSAPRQPRMGPGGPPDARYIDFLAREVGLTAEQQREIEQILKRQQERINELTRETRPQIREVARETRAAVDEVLTAEQRQRLQELRVQRDRMHEQRGQRQGPPPGNGGR
jgi:Spy/CpxP family protein refolding chaperone